jgi:hypothetical protein
MTTRMKMMTTMTMKIASPALLLKFSFRSLVGFIKSAMRIISARFRNGCVIFVILSYLPHEKKKYVRS